MPYVPICLTCSRALRAGLPSCLASYVPPFFYLHNMLSYFYLPYCLTCPHCFTCLTCLYFLRALSAFIFYLPYMSSFFKVFPIFDVPYVTSKFLSQKNPGQYWRITLDQTSQWIYYLVRSSLIYNTSARLERHKCDTSNTNAARVRHKRDRSATQTTRVLHDRHKCDTGEKFGFW